jgi:ubiquinone/menaquinone biosynthesis C-methylase UbiE
VLEAAIESLPLEDGSVAHVWCRDVLNHVRLREALSECFRALRLGGRMLVYQLLGKLCPTVYVLEKPIA